MSQPHPRNRYDAPFDILLDDDLTAEGKLEVLKYWDEEVTERLRAIVEGMNPDGELLGTSEEELAEEQRLVHDALRAWRERFAPNALK